MRCDSHIHVIGPLEEYPQLPTRHYLAEIAELATVEHAAKARDVTRFVVVQPSFYGTDNTMTLEALDALGKRGRGVAVVEPDAPASQLRGLHKRGVRGLRINLYSGLGKPKPFSETFAAMEKTARHMGWHVEVIVPIALLVEHFELLAKAQAPIVIDHYGVYGELRPDSFEGRRMLELLAMPHVWMKVSAPYRVSANHLETRPDPGWLNAILATAPSRCVWGSDWPHTPPEDQQKGANVPGPYRKIGYTALFDDFVAAAGALAERVLRDNPARLYDFADS